MLIEVKSKTNKPDGVPKKKEGTQRDVLGRGGGSLGYWQTNALINFPPEPKSQRKGVEALLRTVGGGLRRRQKEMGFEIYVGCQTTEPTEAKLLH